MPPLPNSNSSSPYPSYPNQTNPSMPQPSPYPRQQTAQYPAPYGAAHAPYGASQAPPYGSAPFGAGVGFMPPQAPPPHTAGYPAMPSSTTVYPPPQSNATYPNQYPSNSHNFPPQQGYSGYGFQQVGPSTGPSYPIVNNMAPSFSQMQGHIKDVRRSKVCVCASFFLSFSPPTALATITKFSPRIYQSCSRHLLHHHRQHNRNSSSFSSRR